MTQRYLAPGDRLTFLVQGTGETRIIDVMYGAHPSILRIRSLTKEEEQIASTTLMIDGEPDDRHTE